MKCFFISSRMCLSEAVQAQQVSPPTDFKLTEMLIDSYGSVARI